MSLSCCRLTDGLRVLGFACVLSGSLVFSQSRDTQVSSDLIALYESTSRAETVDEFSSIIAKCSAVLADKSRSSLDTQYAHELLAWAANKRGEHYSDLAAALAEQGKSEEARKQDDLAGDDYRLALAHDPNRWKARHNLAVALALRSDFDAAIREFGQVIKQKPDYANAHFNRAELYFQQQRYDLAIVDYSSALRLNPNDPMIVLGRAHSEFLLGDTEAALIDYAEAARLAPDNVEILADFADALQSVQQWSQAASVYRRTLELDPDHVRSLENVAWLMATCPDARMRSGSSAVKAIRRAMNRDPLENSKRWDTLAAAYATNGNWNLALEAIENALKLASDREERKDLEYRQALYQKKQIYTQAYEIQPPVRQATEPSSISSQPSRTVPR